MALVASRLLEIKFQVLAGQTPNTDKVSVFLPSLKLKLGALQPSKKRARFGWNSFCLSAPGSKSKT